MVELYAAATDIFDAAGGAQASLPTGARSLLDGGGGRQAASYGPGAHVAAMPIDVAAVQRRLRAEPGGCGRLHAAVLRLAPASKAAARAAKGKIGGRDAAASALGARGGAVSAMASAREQLQQHALETSLATAVRASLPQPAPPTRCLRHSGCAQGAVLGVA